MTHTHIRIDTQKHTHTHEHTYTHGRTRTYTSDTCARALGVIYLSLFCVLFSSPALPFLIDLLFYIYSIHTMQIHTPHTDTHTDTHAYTDTHFGHFFASRIMLGDSLEPEL